MGFLNGLKDRRLFRIVTFYAIAGWGVLQVAGQLIDRGYADEMLYQVLFIWYVTGLPAALLVGWHHGEKGRQRAPISEVSLLVLLGIGALGFTGNTVNNERIRRLVEAQKENPLTVTGLAVRYFEDRSRDGEYEYLADALTEGLIEELQQVSGLNAASRNASAAFRDTDVPHETMAEKLGVATIIRGELEVVDDKVRVHLQIIDGESGSRVDAATVAVLFSDLPTMRTELVSQTATLLRKRVGAELRVREHAAGTSNGDALTLVHRAEKARKEAETAIAEGNLNGGAALFQSADAMLVQAEGADPKWEEPIVQRAAITYRRAYLAQREPETALRYIESTVAHANRALDLNRSNARALELRGTAMYYQWLLRIADTQDQMDDLRESARRDLTAAVRIKPELATAHATLSHFYYGENILEAVLEAEKAFRQDAYLEAADVVLWRLFTGSLDLQQFDNARKYCNEGHRRFEKDYRFVSCDLRMMTVPGETVRIPAAWATLARLDSLLPEPRRAFERVRGEITVAGAIAMAGAHDPVLLDSARSVLNRASRAITPALDPTGELLLTEAYIRILTREEDRAVDLLSRYAAADPEAFDRSKGELPWWYRDLQDHPKVRALFRLN